MNVARRWIAAAMTLGVLALDAGCAASPPPRARAHPAPQPAPLHDGPLTDYVSSAGLRWLVVGRPKELASDAVLKAPLRLLFPQERLDAFAKSSGVGLTTTGQALIAGFDHSTLFMATTPQGSVVAERFAERLLAGPRIHSPHPRIQRITGVVGGSPQTLVHIDGKLAAVSLGSSLPARVVQLYALGKLERSPSALRGAALSSLPVSELESAPVRFYAPGPFTGEWAQGARGLLATSVAAGLAVRPSVAGRLAVDVVLAGDFRGSAGDPAQHLRETWADLASSNLGRLLGLDDPGIRPVVSATPELLRLSVELDPMPLARGLRAAVMAEVWEILRLDASGPGPAPGEAPN